MIRRVDLHHILLMYFNQERSGLAYSLGRQFPGLCGCLATTKAGRDQCLICEERLKTDIQHCDNDDCKFVYCEQCWQDVKVRFMKKRTC